MSRTVLKSTIHEKRKEYLQEFDDMIPDMTSTKNSSNKLAIIIHLQ